MRSAKKSKVKKKKEIAASKSHSILQKKTNTSKEVISPKRDTTMAHILTSF